MQEQEQEWLAAMPMEIAEEQKQELELEQLAAIPTIKVSSQPPELFACACAVPHLLFPVIPKNTTMCLPASHSNSRSIDR